MTATKTNVSVHSTWYELFVCSSRAGGQCPQYSCRHFQQVLFCAVKWYFSIQQRARNTKKKIIEHWIWYFSIMRTYIDRTARFQNDPNITGVYRIYSHIMSKVVSQSSSRGRSVAELKTLCEDVSSFKHIVVIIFSPVCTSGRFKLKLHLLDLSIKDISRSRSLAALEVSL